MSGQNLCDVGVIGGGLAGLCLAIQSAGNGYSTILFEKEAYPFHKVCGEYISRESWNFLKRLGLPLQQMNLPTITTLSLSDAAGEAYDFNLPLGGFGVSRYLLDNALYKIAIAKGVKVCTNAKVTDVQFDDEHFTISTNDVNATCKVAAGCFGKRSNLDVKWNRLFISEKTRSLNNYIGIKYHVRYPHPSAQIALHNFTDGYCGLSKIEDDKSCLCYLTTAKNLRACNNSIDELQQKILYKNKNLQEIFEKAEFLYQSPLAISQVSFSKKLQVENHVLMLGDAAGMITPLCGNGMSMAMHSSKIAFDKISLFLNGKLNREQLERNYTSEWKKNFSSRLFVGRTVQRLFGKDETTRIFLKTMLAIKPLSKLVIQSTHGKAF